MPRRPISPTKPQTVAALKRELRARANPIQAKNLQRFFKTGPGQYGAGDRFLGLKVPIIRQIGLGYTNLKLSELLELLKSPIHEERFCALEILVYQYEHGTERDQKKIVTFYLAQTSHINNWDLVDTSAPYILGNYVLINNRRILYHLAQSKSIWERRIAIVATFDLIRHDQFNDTLKLARQLCDDPHDLIHKAVGWMLREVGKKDEKTLRQFLDTNLKKLPRVTLRYAIERLDRPSQLRYLKQ